ncbi:MAG: hypothetical protein ACYTFO_06850 [Planctomycetota bacterium]
MKRTKQFSFGLENKPGQLAVVTRCLADSKLNIIALSVADTAEQCLLRVVVDKPAVLAKLLKDCPATVSQTEVLLIELANQVGTLAKAAERLKAKRVNVNFIYGSAGKGRGKTFIVVGASNLNSAAKALARL